MSTKAIRLKIMFIFFFNDTATTEIYTLSLHDALPIWERSSSGRSITVLRNTPFAFRALGRIIYLRRGKKGADAKLVDLPPGGEGQRLTRTVASALCEKVAEAAVTLRDLRPWGLESGRAFAQEGQETMRTAPRRRRRAMTDRSRAQTDRSCEASDHRSS